MELFIIIAVALVASYLIATLLTIANDISMMILPFLLLLLVLISAILGLIDSVRNILDACKTVYGKNKNNGGKP